LAQTGGPSGPKPERQGSLPEQKPVLLRL
jgi:hypothetical protein